MGVRCGAVVLHAGRGKYCRQEEDTAATLSSLKKDCMCMCGCVHVIV